MISLSYKNACITGTLKNDKYFWRLNILKETQKNDTDDEISLQFEK